MAKAFYIKVGLKKSFRDMMPNLTSFKKQIILLIRGILNDYFIFG